MMILYLMLAEVLKAYGDIVNFFTFAECEKVNV